MNESGVGEDLIQSQISAGQRSLSGPNWLRALTYCQTGAAMAES